MDIIKNDNIEKILLIRFGSLGDVVLTLPVIEAVRRSFPKAYIAMLVGEKSADIVSADDRLDEIIVFQREKKGLQGLSETFRIENLIRKKHFDVSVDMQRKFRSSLIAYDAGIKYRIGYHQPYGLLCNYRIPDKENKHSIDRNLDLLQPFGIKDFERIPKMILSKEDRDFANRYFNLKNLSNSVVFGIFPGAGWRPRCWMPERFAEICDRANAKYNTKTIIFGGPNESDIVNNVAQNMNTESIIMNDKVTLRQLAAMIEKCNLMLSNDTGPMHISVAVNTPTIALFGPGNYKKFQPIGEKHSMIRKNVPCSPCKQFTNRCKDNICMKLITVDDVWEVVDQRLGYIKT
ncbi:MAG: lipopolysaccharide heptosyltransferase II [bacterium]